MVWCGLRSRVCCALLLLSALGGCRHEATLEAAEVAGAQASAQVLDKQLRFEGDDAEPRALSVAQLAGHAPLEVFTAPDPYYKAPKTWRAMPMAPLLRAAFPKQAEQLASLDFILSASDGYAVPITGARLMEPGAYVAVEDVEVAGWAPIGPGQVNPGPFYVVWREPHQQDKEVYPRPWQLASIAIARFEQTHAHTLPTGLPKGDMAWEGFELFKAQCVRCHAMNREGGRVGPELNVPQSITEYRPEAQIRAYIKNPLTFRYGNMPAFEHLSEAQLDQLMAYLRVMRERKHDPESRDTPSPPEVVSDGG